MFRNFLFVLGLLITVLIAVAFPGKPAVDLSRWHALRESYDVRILRDTWGVPHIFGKTDPDTAFGLAYAHAEDDFENMQLVLLATHGKLATVLGMDGAANDYMVRLLRIWEVVNTRFATDLSADTLAVLQGYADGMTYYAATHPEEIMSMEVYPVTAKALVAASVHRSPLFFGLDSTLGDLFAETRQSEVSKFGAVTQTWPDPATGNQVVAWEKSIAGSNTFALGPSRTIDGSTFFASNSHQPWEGPVAWYEAHVHSEEGWDAVGALFPGAPFVLVGHNRDLGWSFNVNSPDLIDVFVLEVNPDNENQYLLDGEWRDFEIRSDIIRVRIFGELNIPVRQSFLWSVYGPVMRQPHGTYAVRYAGYGKINIWEQFYRMNRATNFSEWQDAMRLGALPMFNAGYADKEGNIYYLYNGLIPLRQEGWDWSLYIPGTSSETLWTETIAFEDLPQVLNPDSGFIQNANSSPFQTTIRENPDPRDYSPSLGIETHMTNRALRLLEIFSGNQIFSFDEFIRAKWDLTYSQDSDVARYVAVVLTAEFDDPLLLAAQAQLREWDLRVNPENKSAALGILMLNSLNRRIDAFRPSAMVGVEVSDALVLESFKEAAAHLVAHFGKIGVDWQEVNRLQRGDLNIGLGGGPDIIHAVYGRLSEDGRFIGTNGDGVVVLVRWKPDGTLESYSIHQYGSATLDKTSPHYADQAPLFANRQMKPIWMDKADILANLEQAYVPGDEIKR